MEMSKSNGANGSRELVGSDASTTTILASVGAGDRLINALWSKVLATPLPSSDNPEAFFAALRKRYERVITDEYGMSKVVPRSRVSPIGMTGYVTAQNSVRGAVADSVAAKVQECVRLLDAIKAEPLDTCGDAEDQAALIPGLVDDLQRLPKLLEFEEGTRAADKVLKNLGLPESSSDLPSSGTDPAKDPILVRIKHAYGLDPSSASTLEETNTGTNFMHLIWKLREIDALLEFQEPKADLYTIQACFGNAAPLVQRVRDRFAQCGVSTSSFKLPGVNKTFEEILWNVEYLIEPSRVERVGARWVVDHMHDLADAVSALGDARPKTSGGKVDPDDDCLPECYAGAGRDINALYCAAEDCLQVVDKFNSTYKPKTPCSSGAAGDGGSGARMVSARREPAPSEKKGAK